MKVFATHNPDTKNRFQSSSGGIFTLLAERVIREGGVVYGAAFDASWAVVHRRVETLEGIAALRGSKYVFSDFLSAVKDAMAYLEAGRRVLFSGTPCQVAAMRKRAGNNPRLLLVEVVCHGAPRPEYWARYLDELCHAKGKTIADISAINFRDKRTGWRSYNFTVTFKDGTDISEHHGKNLYIKGFLLNYTLRRACLSCPFKYPEGSKADVSLGDFWGINKLAPQIQEGSGISLVIARTNRGIDSLSEIDKAVEFDFEEIFRLHPALTQSAKMPARYDKAYMRLSNSKSIIDVLRAITRTPLKLQIKIFIASLLKINNRCE